VTGEHDGLFFEQVGHGAPLLLVHGNGLDHTVLRPWHDPLADEHRLVYYDCRWNGRSVREGAVDHAGWHVDAIGLLDRLGVERATLLGHSYGGWLALGLAAAHPERVSGLILCGASPAFDYMPEVVANAQARDPEAARILVEGLSNGVATDDELKRVWHDILPLYFHGEPRYELLQDVRFSAVGFTHSMRALEGFSMVERLPSMHVPMLVLVGKDDYITPPSQARRLATLAPSARVIEFEHSGHFPFAEEQEAYMKAIRDWLHAP
jgi:proline iminopeptidase